MTTMISKILTFVLIILFGIKIARINMMLAILLSATLITLAFRLLILVDEKKHNNKVFKQKSTLIVLIILNLILGFFVYKDVKENKSFENQNQQIENQNEQENTQNDKEIEKEKSFNEVQNNEENFKEATLKEALSDNEIKLNIDGVDKNIKLLALDEDTENKNLAKNYINENLKESKIYIEKDNTLEDENKNPLRNIWIEKPDDLKNPREDELTTKQLNGILLFNGYSPLKENIDSKYMNTFISLNNKAKEEFKGIYEVRPQEEQNENENKDESQEEIRDQEEENKEEEKVDDVSFYDGFSIEDTTKDGQADGRFAIIRINSSMIDDNKLQEFYENFVLQKDFKYVVVLFTDYTEPSGIYATKEEVLRNIAFNVDSNGNYNPIDTEEKIVYKKDGNNKLIKQN